MLKKSLIYNSHLITLLFGMALGMTMVLYLFSLDDGDKVVDTLPYIIVSIVIFAIVLRVIWLIVYKKQEYC